MLTPNVLDWQWHNYPLAHRDRRNLLIHALTVPLFVSGIACLPFTVAFRHPLLAGAEALLAGAAFGAQGWGHAQEAQAPAPFRSRLDAVVRLFAEQFVTFPRFVFSGGFARAWAHSAAVDA